MIGSLSRRRFALQSLAGAGALLASPLLTRPARAEFPDHTITGVVPFGAGGPSDVISRIVAASLSKELNQAIVMQNKAGAAGNIGIAQVAHAAPDGYTLLFCSIATTQNPAVFRTLPFDPLTDLAPVAFFGSSPFITAVNSKNVPVKTLKEFFALVQKNPGKYNIAAGGGGQRMSLERFMLQNDLKMELVNYNSGGEATNAIISGEADFVLNDATTLTAAYQSGRVTLLAIAGASRLPALPDVPTTAEAGYPDYTDQNYVAMYAPGRTPPDILKRLHDATNRALATAEVGERFRALGYIPAQQTLQEFDDFYRREIARWKDVAQKAHIEPVD